MIDAVITYVNANDSVWRKSWEERARREGMADVQRIDGARWRDFGTLPMLVGGIRRWMPWIRKVFVIVACETQIDKNIKGVEWVMHEDIIPKELLPTFNSTVIELFMWRIKDLSEQFIYFNDDMFPINSMKEEDFFVEGKPAITLQAPRSVHYSMYAFHLRNTYKIAAEVAEKKMCNGEPIRTGHTASSMLKSTWGMLWSKKNVELMAACTPFRTTLNVNQDLAAYWHLLTDNYVVSNRRIAYTTLANIDIAERIVNEGRTQVLCVNDTKKTQDKDAAGRRLRELLMKNNSL